MENALDLTKFLIKLEKLTKNWDIGRMDRSEISHRTAYKLLSIWHQFNHDLRLFPAFLAVVFFEFKSWWYKRF